jgi:hypothetical protein
VVAKIAEAGRVEASRVFGRNRDSILVAEEFVGDFFVRHLSASFMVGKTGALGEIGATIIPPRQP